MLRWMSGPPPIGPSCDIQNGADSFGTYPGSAGFNSPGSTGIKYRGLDWIDEGNRGCSNGISAGGNPGGGRIDGATISGAPGSGIGGGAVSAGATTKGSCG